MKKNILPLLIILGIIASMSLGIWLLFRGDASINELSKITTYSKAELIFLEEQGFLDELKTGEAPKNKEETLSLIKPATLIEQNLNTEKELFEVLAAKLDEKNYQLAFKLENKTEQEKEFFLIPISDGSQLLFQGIERTVSINKPLAEIYDIEKHKQDLRPELAKAYDDIENNNYQASPVKITLKPKSTLIASSKWQIRRGPSSTENLKPVYLLVYGSAGGAKDEFEDEVSLKKVQQKYEQAAEIKAKYQLEGFSLKRITKDNPKDRIEVVIGNKDDVEFSPDLKIARWDNEVNMIIKPKLLEGMATEDKNLKFEGNKIKLETPKTNYILYELPTSEENPEGGFEYQIDLLEKPATNKTEFTLDTKGLDFFYQPELTQEEKDRGDIRPENVVGSWAIYASENKTNWVGGKEYRVGKMGHIFRPKIIDSAGTEVWGDLHIENGILSVIIPQDFLDNAVYPVVVDPTFGYTSVGATRSGWPADYLVGFPYTSPADIGTVNSITIYLTDATSYHTKGVVVAANSTLVPNGIGSVISYTGSGGWATSTLSSPPSLSPGVTYYLCQISDANVGLRRDAVAGGVYHSNSYTTPTNPTFTSISQQFSIYATYTAAGGGGAVRIKGGFKVKGGLKIKF